MIVIVIYTLKKKKVFINQQAYGLIRENVFSISSQYICIIINNILFY